MDLQRHKQVQKDKGNHAHVHEYMHIGWLCVQVYHPHWMTEPKSMEADPQEAHREP